MISYKLIIKALPILNNGLYQHNPLEINKLFMKDLLQFSDLVISVNRKIVHEHLQISLRDLTILLDLVNFLCYLDMY